MKQVKLDPNQLAQLRAWSLMAQRGAAARQLIDGTLLMMAADAGILSTEYPAIRVDGDSLIASDGRDTCNQPPDGL